MDTQIFILAIYGLKIVASCFLCHLPLPLLLTSKKRYFVRVGWWNFRCIMYTCWANRPRATWYPWFMIMEQCACANAIRNFRLHNRYRCHILRSSLSTGNLWSHMNAKNIPAFRGTPANADIEPWIPCLAANAHQWPASVLKATSLYNSVNCMRLAIASSLVKEKPVRSYIPWWNTYPCCSHLAHLHYRRWLLPHLQHGRWYCQKKRNDLYQYLPMDPLQPTATWVSSRWP